MSISPMSAIAEAPVFRPTAEEWAVNPAATLSRIRRAAGCAGIARVIPPAGWNPGHFSLSTATLVFPVRVQFTSQSGVAAAAAAGTAAARLDFLASLAAHLRLEGGQTCERMLEGWANGRAVDLHALWTLVAQRGGADGATRRRSWGDVARLLRVRRETLI